MSPQGTLFFPLQGVGGGVITAAVFAAVPTLRGGAPRREIDLLVRTRLATSRSLRWTIAGV